MDVFNGHVARSSDLDPAVAAAALRHVLRRYDLGHESATETRTILQALGLIDYTPGSRRRQR
jgi:hypothetical protein